MCLSCGRDPTAIRRPCKYCGKITPSNEATCCHCGMHFRNELIRKILLIVVLFVAAFTLNILIRAFFD